LEMRKTLTWSGDCGEWMVFQFSIGDAACTSLALRTAVCNWFQFSIGDAQNKKHPNRKQGRTVVSILYWRCHYPRWGSLYRRCECFNSLYGDASSRCYDDPFVHGSKHGFNSLLEMPPLRGFASHQRLHGVSILYWRCRRNNRNHHAIPKAREVSILYWR